MSETMYEILILYKQHIGFTHNFIRLKMVLHEITKWLLLICFTFSKIFRLRRYYNITNLNQFNKKKNITNKILQMRIAKNV